LSRTKEAASRQMSWRRSILPASEAAVNHRVNRSRGNDPFLDAIDRFLGSGPCVAEPKFSMSISAVLRKVFGR
jgi:hypothetical protein